MDSNLTLALNSAMVEMMRARTATGGNFAGPIDQKRGRAWCEYGYPSVVDFSMLYNLYSRGGLAFGAVEKLVALCWKTNPWVIQGDDNSDKESPWEVAVKKITNVAFWRALKEADRRRLVGRYSAVLLRIADNQLWDKPAGAGKLVGLVPAWANQLTPGTIDIDTWSENYGKPVDWQYTAGSESFKVHPSRIFILGDWSENAIGYLQPVFNDFINVEKLSGGSGESFLKNAARQMNINFDKDVRLSEIASAHGVKPQDLHKVFDDATRGLNIGIDTMLMTQGATVTPMVASMPDVEKPYDVSVSNIASGVNMPKRILIGSQSGERASTEDREEFNATGQSRRIGDLSFEFTQLIQHLQTIKVVPAMEDFSIAWDDLTTPTDAARLANAKTLAEINKQYEGAGQEPFNINEVREAAGFEPLETGAPMGETDEG